MLGPMRQGVVPALGQEEEAAAVAQAAAESEVKAAAEAVKTATKRGVARRAAGTKAGTKRRRPSAKQRARALEVIERLDQEMPDAHIELDFSNDIEMLVAVMLSAQCTDAMVNRCTPSLFAAFPTVADYARAEPEDLYPHISRCGLYRSKAKNIVATMRILESEYDGQLPKTREELQTLPGVGKKTAGVVAVYALGGQAFPVDTHVGRIATRLGFTKETNPDKIELDLQALLPPETWGQGHQLLVWHGRRTCAARRPRCEECVVEELCPKKGV